MKRAFSLIEILILLAILLIVAAILFPVISRPNPSGSSKLYCQSNLKQIGLGFLQYAQDYDDHFPIAHVSPTIGWADAIFPYTKSTQILQCSRTPSSAPQSTDYFYNRRLSGLNPKSVRSPAQTILAGDGNNDAPMWSSIARLPSRWTATDDAPALRHLDRANYLFVDGHVKDKPPIKVKPTLLPKSDTITFSIR